MQNTVDGPGLGRIPAPLYRWSAVQPLLQDGGRWSRYRALLQRFGIRPSLVEEARPRAFFSEHPGSWFYPNDAQRVALTEALSQRLGTDPWVMQFHNDAFRANGIKRFFARWQLYEGSGWSWLVRPVHRRLWQHRTYGSITLDPTAVTRLRRQFEGALEMLREASSHRQLWALLDRSQPDDVRQLLGPPRSRTAVRVLGQKLDRHDLDAARRPLQAGLDALREDPVPTWATLWRRINECFVNRPIASVDPLFGRFLLAIEDPEKMARELARRLPRESNRADGESVPVAGFVTPEGEFRLVTYDLERRRFLALGGGETRAIDWSEVRSAVEAGRSAGPSGIVEYLSMAALGILIVGDPGDGHTPFERRVDRLHREAIGHPFPWVSLRLSYSPGETGAYLDAFHPDFSTRTASALEEFFS